jgi:dienelactone hydrolase
MNGFHSVVSSRVRIGLCLSASALLLLVLLAGAYLMLPRLGSLKPSGSYPVGEYSLDATQLGIRVAQLPGRQAGRDLRVHLIFPAGANRQPDAKAGPMPILIYFPGWPGSRSDNIGLLRDLASHGYFIAAVTYNREDSRLEGEMSFSTDQAAEKTLWVARTKVALQAEDASSILDALGHLNANDSAHHLEGKLNPGRAAVLGFSFGGAVAAEACAHDPRFRAALNMDGWLYGDGARLSFAQPYFLMSDDDTDPSPAELASPDPATRNAAVLSARDFRQIRERLKKPDSYMITILGTQHESFSDTPLHYSLRRAGMPGPMEALRVSSIIRAYARAFFDTYLKDAPASLLKSTPSPYPEVKLPPVA